MSSSVLEELRDDQRSVWNQSSDGWNRWDAFMTAWWQPVAESMLRRAGLEAASEILDVATGSGEPGLSAARLAPRARVTGLDVAGDMLAVAQEKARAHGIHNFVTRHYDGMQMPFDDAFFDVILCRFGIMFFPDMDASLRDIARVTRPGGRVVMASWLEPARNPFVAVPMQVVFEALGIEPPADAPGIFRCGEPGALGRLLRAAGLDEVEEEEITRVADFGTLDQYWAWIMNVPAPVTALILSASTEQQAAIKSEVFQAASRFEHDGRLMIPWAACVAAGRTPSA